MDYITPPTPQKQPDENTLRRSESEGTRLRSHDVKKNEEATTNTGGKNDNDWNQWNDSEEDDFPPAPTSQSQVCFDWNGNPAGVARQHTYTHDLSFRISDNCLKTSRFVFEQERWNVITTKNVEVVLINLFYNKVYKTSFFYKNAWICLWLSVMRYDRLHVCAAQILHRFQST